MEITRTELSAVELRRAAARSREADAARRMLALALVLEGKSRKEAAETCGLDRQRLAGLGHPLQHRGSPGIVGPQAAWAVVPALVGADGRAL